MKKSSSCIASCSLTALFFLFLLAVIVAGLFITLQAHARQVFGEPSPVLGSFERVVLSLRLVLQEDDLMQPAATLTTPAGFHIDFGEPTGIIIQRLHQGGLIRNSEALRDYLQYRGLDTSIQAGEYEINPGMSAVDIAWMMQDATPTHVHFTVLPGWRLEEIAASLATSGLEITSEDFLLAARSPVRGRSFSRDNPIGSTAEGFLHPGSYNLPRDITTSHFLETLLNSFETNLTAELQQGFNFQGLDVYQAVTIASIVEREAVVKEEMPTIVSVYLNRLRAGMKLDADPTIQYALGYNETKKSWWTSPLSLADLEVESQYNTYRNSGLPPGPISNPSLQALHSVAFPETTPYFYFRAACDGSGRHVFSETFEEHVQNACP